MIIRNYTQVFHDTGQRYPAQTPFGFTIHTKRYKLIHFAGSPEQASTILYLKKWEEQSTHATIPTSFIFNFSQLSQWLIYDTIRKDHEATRENRPFKDTLPKCFNRNKEPKQWIVQAMFHQEHWNIKLDHKGSFITMTC